MMANDGLLNLHAVTALHIDFILRVNSNLNPNADAKVETNARPCICLLESEGEFGCKRPKIKAKSAL